MGSALTHTTKSSVDIQEVTRQHLSEISHTQQKLLELQLENQAMLIKLLNVHWIH